MKKYSKSDILKYIVQFEKQGFIAGSVGGSAVISKYDLTGEVLIEFVTIRDVGKGRRFKGFQQLKAEILQSDKKEYIAGKTFCFPTEDELKEDIKNLNKEMKDNEKGG